MPDIQQTMDFEDLVWKKKGLTNNFYIQLKFFIFNDKIIFLVN